MSLFKNKRGKSTLANCFFFLGDKLLLFFWMFGVGVLVVGWYFWKTSKQFDNILEVSRQYEIVLSEIREDWLKKLSIAEKFSAGNENIYGTLVTLKLAQLYVKNNELDKASEQLQNRLALIKDNHLKSLIAFRLARIFIEQKKEDDALKILQSIRSNGFSSVVSDLYGEALLRKGDKYGAHNAWKTGLNNSISPALSEVLDMKINNLSL